MPGMPRPSVRRVACLVLVAVVAAGCAGSASTGSQGSDGASTTLPPATAPPATAPPTTAPPTTTPPTTTPPTTTTTVPVDPTTVAEEGPLRPGSVGSRTKAVQAALAEVHYDPGPADGKFGTKTTQAVWAFQALHGLARDGVVGPDTEAAILARPDQAMLRPDHGPTHTEVDLTRQVMIVWKDGAPLLITHVSTGSEVPYCEPSASGRNCGDAVTPTGVYRYQRRISGWRVAPLGRLYNPVYFTGGIAVHGATSVPDRPASHGCVRISMSIAEYFPALVADGDVIDVFRS